MPADGIVCLWSMSCLLDESNDAAFEDDEDEGSDADSAPEQPADTTTDNSSVPDEDGEDEDRPARLLARCAGHTAPVRVVRWSPGGRFLASGGDDGLIKLWERREALSVRAGIGESDEAANHENWVAAVALQGHRMEVQGLAWSPCGGMLASCALDSKVLVWRLAPGGAGLRAEASAAEAAALGAVVEAPSRTQSAPVSTLTLREPSAVLAGHDSFVRGVAWDPSGLLLASLGDRDGVRLWRLAVDGTADQAAEEGDEEEAEEAEAASGTPSRDGARSEDAGGSRGIAGVFAALTAQRGDDDAAGTRVGSPLWSQAASATHLFGDGVEARMALRLSWSPDGDTLACPAGFSSPRFVAPMLGRGDGSVRHQMVGHAGAVTASVFAPRGWAVGGSNASLLATGDDSGEIAVWSEGRPRPVAVLAGAFSAPVSDAAWGHGAQVLLACGLDGAVVAVDLRLAGAGSPLGLAESRAWAAGRRLRARRSASGEAAGMLAAAVGMRGMPPAAYVDSDDASTRTPDGWDAVLPRHRRVRAQADNASVSWARWRRSAGRAEHQVEVSPQLLLGSDAAGRKRIRPRLVVVDDGEDRRRLDAAVEAARRSLDDALALHARRGGPSWWLATPVRPVAAAAPATPGGADAGSTPSGTGAAGRAKRPRPPEWAERAVLAVSPPSGDPAAFAMNARMRRPPVMPAARQGSAPQLAMLPPAPRPATQQVVSDGARPARRARLEPELVAAPASVVAAAPSDAQRAPSGPGGDAAAGPMAGVALAAQAGPLVVASVRLAGAALPHSKTVRAALAPADAQPAPSSSSSSSSSSSPSSDVAGPADVEAPRPSLLALVAAHSSNEGGLSAWIASGDAGTAPPGTLCSVAAPHAAKAASATVWVSTLQCRRRSGADWIARVPGSVSAVAGVDAGADGAVVAAGTAEGSVTLLGSAGQMLCPPLLLDASVVGMHLQQLGPGVEGWWGTPAGPGRPVDARLALVVVTSDGTLRGFALGRPGAGEGLAARSVVRCRLARELLAAGSAVSRITVLAGGEPALVTTRPDLGTGAAAAWDATSETWRMLGGADALLSRSVAALVGAGWEDPAGTEGEGAAAGWARGAVTLAGRSGGSAGLMDAMRDAEAMQRAAAAVGDEEGARRWQLLEASLVSRCDDAGRAAAMCASLLQEGKGGDVTPWAKQVLRALSQGPPRVRQAAEAALDAAMHGGE